MHSSNRRTTEKLLNSILNRSSSLLKIILSSVTELLLSRTWETIFQQSKMLRESSRSNLTGLRDINVKEKLLPNARLTLTQLSLLKKQ